MGAHRTHYDAEGLKGRATSALMEVLLILGIFITVGAFGGTEPASFAIVEALILAAAVLLVASPGTVELRSLMKTALVPAVFVSVILVQLCPIPRSLLEHFGRQADPGTSAATLHLSMEAYSTRTDLLIALTCSAAFCLAQVIGRDRQRKRRLIYSLIALGCFEAFYGLFQYLSGWQQIFTYVKKYDLAEATGTYINRNHYAGLLEMLLPLSLALAFYEYTNVERGQRQARARAGRMVTRTGFQRLVLWFSTAVVIFGALVFSRSRMGIIAGCLSLLTMFGFIAASRFRVRNLLILSAAFILTGFCFALWIGPGPITERFQGIEQEYSLGDQSRLSIWRDDLNLVRRHPWLGTGLGTFPIAFTAVQTTFLGQFVNHAHNDYLELASDVGIPAALMLFAAIGFVFMRAVRTFLSGEGNFERIVALGCVGSMTAMLLHAMADFNFYIPANALVFSTILGLAVSSYSKPSQDWSQRVAG
jgi:putative inorganic carbon (hco3(-)) transporter